MVPFLFPSGLLLCWQPNIDRFVRHATQHDFEDVISQVGAADILGLPVAWSGELIRPDQRRRAVGHLKHRFGVPNAGSARSMAKSSFTVYREDPFGSKYNVVACPDSVVSGYRPVVQRRSYTRTRSPDTETKTKRYEVSRTC